jgi:HPt (histidine-containing phosphotransfer) domain-containing protein
VSDFDATMTVLKARFVARAKEDLNTLRGDGNALSAEELRAVVHRLAGSAGLFGFSEISAVAGDIDLHLAQGHATAGLPELLAMLERLTASAPG